MKKPPIHLVSLSALIAALLMAIPLSSESADPPKPQPTSAPSDADHGLTEGGIEFNSKLALDVMVCHDRRLGWPLSPAVVSGIMSGGGKLAIIHTFVSPAAPRVSQSRRMA